MHNKNNLPYAVVCGGANIDIGAHSFAPLRDRDSNPGRVELSLGGVGRNIAHNMRLLGVPTYLLTAIGGDSRALQIEQSCRELGIDLSHALRVPDGRTSTYVFVGGSDGDMAIAVSDMEICEKLTPDYFVSQLDLLNGAAAVVIDANLPRGSIAYLTEHCTAPIFIDPVSTVKAEKLRGLLARVHTLKPNRRSRTARACVRPRKHCLTKVSSACSSPSAATVCSPHSAAKCTQRPSAKRRCATPPARATR